MTSIDKIPDIDVRTLEYKHPVFIPSEDGDEASIQFYKNAGVPVALIQLPYRRRPHFYAIQEAETQEEADKQNRGMNSMDKSDARTENKESGQKDGVKVLSYDSLVEDGFDAAKEDGNLEEVVAYKMMVDALCKEYGELTEENRRFCDAVKENRTDRDMAGEMGLAKSTYQGRKAKALRDLGEKMKDWK